MLAKFFGGAADQNLRRPSKLKNRPRFGFVYQNFLASV
jgi:hypothetical protein